MFTWDHRKLLKLGTLHFVASCIRSEMRIPYNPRLYPKPFVDNESNLMNESNESNLIDSDGVLDYIDTLSPKMTDCVDVVRGGEADLSEAGGDGHGGGGEARALAVVLQQLAQVVPL